MSRHWIVFDYGEVLCSRTTAVPKMAAALGVGVAEFEPAYWGLREAYDRGSADLEYWRSIGAAVGAEVDEAMSETLTELDIEGWSHLEPTSLELVEALSEADASLALLSNAPSSFGRWVEQQEFSKLFEVLLFSGDVKMAKPDAEIYRELLSRLDASPGDCLFLDDRQSNVDGANAVGVRAHRWLGAAEARSWLEPEK